jgi:UDP-2,3-diacylglucosamine pyrophosphatase LpxH
MSRILVIPDVHLPFQRKTFLKDLSQIVQKVRPEKVVIIGDLVDSYAISKHTPSADSPDATTEFMRARSGISEINRILGKRPVFYCLGNHEMRLSKVADTVRIPSLCLKSLRDIFSIPKHWKMALDFVVDGIYFVHYKSTTGGKAAATYGMSTVMGHMHARCSIEYSQTPVKTYWQAFTGCYADDESLAMRYASESARKSVPAFLFIEDGHPRIIRY